MQQGAILGNEMKRERERLDDKGTAALRVSK